MKKAACITTTEHKVAAVTMQGRRITDFHEDSIKEAHRATVARPPPSVTDSALRKIAALPATPKRSEEPSPYTNHTTMEPPLKMILAREVLIIPASELQS